MTGARWHTLPCGRDPQRLLDVVADGMSLPAGAHESTCPYCQAALRELDELWEPVRQWATRPIELPQAFLAAVIARIRRLAQSPRHVATTSAKGATTVTSWVLGLIATDATRSTAGVAAITGASGAAVFEAGRRRAVRYSADGVDIDEVDAAAVAVTLGVTAGAVSDLSAMADGIRHNVMAAITTQTTIPVTRVDVRVDDYRPAFTDGS